MYKVYIFHSRAYVFYHDFLDRGSLRTKMLFNQPLEMLKSAIRKISGHHHGSVYRHGISDSPFQIVVIQFSILTGNDLLPNFPYTTRLVPLFELLILSVHPRSHLFRFGFCCSVLYCYLSFVRFLVFFS